MNDQQSSPHNAYFNDSEASVAYQNDLHQLLEKLTPFLSTKKLRNLRESKLRPNPQSFSEKQYLQTACELTVCGHFAAAYPDTFKYEPALNPPKDVDCSFGVEGVTYNIEVKCADYTKAQAIDGQDAFKISFLGRHPDFLTLRDQLAPIFETPEDGKPLVVQQNMDNKMKDYLESAHQKFSSTPTDDAVNILAVCCDTPQDMQKWYHYLIGAEGLFTQESFTPQAAYSRVDAVYLTNLYHRHKDYSSKSNISNHWSLSDSFGFIVSNPFRALDKRELLNRCLTLLPNYSQELRDFEFEEGLPIEVQRGLFIQHFVAEFLLPRGIKAFN
ncbi:hypothetical protein [Pseudomonas putida]|uniref:hypothetical protein n=1 Tax=Pseudomonas TaxID=286 RepID=UPI001074EB85|nr:hypothetical protein [Pseudomonas putida]MCG3646502.1 hypothetical protein [Pseudomonas putida]MDD2076820.1 hypothetical protein [Pseudomonas putida]TFW19269.1 hypothetical protein E4L40_24240 [Pseudomonas putida]HDS1693031.1 hypothetical protein [Pseudomonas putida]